MRVYALPLAVLHFDLQFDLDQPPPTPAIDEPRLAAEPAFNSFLEQAFHVVEWEKMAPKIVDAEVQLIPVLQPECDHRIIFYV